MTILYLYYNQPEALQELKNKGYDKCPFPVHIVDDGSQIPLKCTWATVHRINYDIAWNQPYANNYGFSRIKNKDYVLRMDIDHYFTIQDLKRISTIELEKKEVVYFDRKGLKPHPNIFLTRVEDILSIGGYNEDFCGNYGYDDKELKHRMKINGFNFSYSNIQCHTNFGQSVKGLNRSCYINYKKYLNAIK